MCSNIVAVELLGLQIVLGKANKGAARNVRDVDALRCET